MKQYELYGVLDKCTCGELPMWVYSSQRHMSGQPANCAECSECAEAIDWQPERWQVMVAWNRHQTQLKK